MIISEKNDDRSARVLLLLSISIMSTTGHLQLRGRAHVQRRDTFATHPSQRVQLLEEGSAVEQSRGRHSLHLQSNHLDGRERTDHRDQLLRRSEVDR